MARSKTEPIVSLGSGEDKLIVQKSLPLFALWRSNLSLPEFKILDTYLSRIDSHKPDKRVVTFAKGELEEILGVDRIKTGDLDERLKNLMTTVKLEDSSYKRGFTRIALFEEAVAEKDTSGMWQVRLECTQKAMKYIFNIENVGYLRYKLRCITQLKSRYTYIMFMYLEANRFRKSWVIDLEELKTLLNCETEEYAKEFKYFNRDVLKKVQSEIHKKTECRYSYTPKKKGRTVIAIQFTVETLPRNTFSDYDPNQITIEDYLEQSSPDLWEEAVKNSGYSFTKEQLEEIRVLLASVPERKLPEDNATGSNAYEIRQYHYIANHLAVIKRRDSEKPIKNKFAYLSKMIRKDAGIE